MKKYHIPSAISISRFVKDKILQTIRIHLSKKYLKRNKLTIPKDISIISNNCLGGVIYHDFELEFKSPTINCFFMADDYVKYISNLEYYNTLDVRAEIDSTIRNNTIILYIGDICAHFIHDNNPEKVVSDWYRRRERVNMENLFIIGSDRDGWNDEAMEIFKRCPYNKCFFTVNKKWKDEPFSIYIKIYSRKTEFPDVTRSRGQYVSQKLFKMMCKC